MIVAIDTEITTYNTGHVFDPRNSLVCFSYAIDGGDSGAMYWNEPNAKQVLQQLLHEATTIVFFNGKFDLQWLVKEGLSYNPVKVWDCQLAEFLISHQTNKFPSLNDTCIKYNLPIKPDKVKEYWDKGVNTDQIPKDILFEYAEHDAQSTLAVYLKQQESMTKKQKTLCKLQCQDLSILREMEFNGLAFNEALCMQRAQELDEQISNLNNELSSTYPDIPINFNSNDHLSAFLYGGTIVETVKEVSGFYKTGKRAGEVKYTNKDIEHTLPRLYTPLKGSEMAKEGNYAVDEATLRKLKGKAHTVSKLLELAKLEKLNGTYYKGLIELRKKMGWEPGILHGQFNQCVAATGRLSSSKPNVQNFASDLQDIFVSTIDD